MLWEPLAEWGRVDSDFDELSHPSILKVNFHHHRENCELLCTKSCHESMHQICEEVSNIELYLCLVGLGLHNFPQLQICVQI